MHPNTHIHAQVCLSYLNKYPGEQQLRGHVALNPLNDVTPLPRELPLK